MSVWQRHILRAFSIQSKKDIPQSYKNKWGGRAWLGTDDDRHIRERDHSDGEQ